MSFRSGSPPSPAGACWPVSRKIVATAPHRVSIFGSTFSIRIRWLRARTRRACFSAASAAMSRRRHFGRALPAVT
jgi:hypothetical protein